MARFNLAQQNENVYSFPQSITTDTVNLVSPQAELTVISLENARGSHALLSNVGCALLSLEIGGVDVVLGYDTPAQYLDDEFYLGVVVGPVAGRVARGELELDGQTWRLPTGVGGHHLHGESAGFGKRVWQVVDASGGRVCFQYQRAHGEGGPPGELKVTVDYELTADDVLVVRYHAQADRPTVCSPTQHSYFNLAGHANGDVMGHELKLDAERYIPLEDDLIPRCGPVPVEATPMDLRNSCCLRDCLAMTDRQLEIGGGFDHTWVLNSGRDWQATPAGTVREPNTGHTLDVYTDRPGLHIFTANWAKAESAGKQGARYAARQGLCLETQHIPRPQFDAAAVRVAPGEDFRSETRFAFSGFQGQA